MLRRLLLGFTFLAAFTTVGVGTPDTADAWGRWGWRRPYVSYYSGPPRAYYYNRYGQYRAYGPRFYRPVYGRYYYGPDYYHYGPRAGVSVSFGF
jgi:hypothetical protein